MAVPYIVNPDYLGKEIETTYDLSNRLIKNYADVNDTARRTFRNFQDDAWVQNARLFQNQDNIRAEEFAALTQPGRLLGGDTFNKQNQIQNTVTTSTMPLAIDTGVKNAQLTNRNLDTSLINSSTAQDIARINAATQPGVVGGQQAAAINAARVTALEQVRRGLLSIDDFNRVRTQQGDAPITAEELQGIVANANTAEATNALRLANPQYFLAGGQQSTNGQVTTLPNGTQIPVQAGNSTVDAFTGGAGQDAAAAAQQAQVAANDAKRAAMVSEAQQVNPYYTPMLIEGLNNIRPGLAKLPAAQASAALAQMQIANATETIRLETLLRNTQQREVQRAFANGRGNTNAASNPQISAAMSEVARKLEGLRRGQQQLDTYQRLLQTQSVAPQTAEQILGGR